MSAWMGRRKKTHVSDKHRGQTLGLKLALHQCHKTIFSLQYVKVKYRRRNVCEEAAISSIVGHAHWDSNPTAKARKAAPLNSGRESGEDAEHASVLTVTLKPH